MVDYTWDSLLKSRIKEQNIIIRYFFIVPTKCDIFKAPIIIIYSARDSPANSRVDGAMQSTLIVLIQLTLRHNFNMNNRMGGLYI